METIEKNLELFREIISCSHNLHFWTYDSDMGILYSNCPEEVAFHTFFAMNGNRDYILQYAKKNDAPLVLSNSMGLIWIADFEKTDGVLQKVHVLGPTFVGDISMKSVENALQKLNLSTSLKAEFIHLLKSIPVIVITHVFEYGLMLHYCITGEKIRVSDLSLQESDLTFTIPNVQNVDRHGTWAAEQAMLKLVRDGNLNYKAAMNRLVNAGRVGKMSKDDPIRQFKNTVIVFTALCMRAAIGGGLSPEIAYTLSDRYIQNVEESQTLTEISEVSRMMQDDFIHRVHRCKENMGISQPIRVCCDYISLHLEEKISIHDIATQVGYTEYYLTKKFKREMKCSISNYMKKVKVEQAKLLLISENQSIQEISEVLGFCSQSYFAEIFRKFTGATPGEYRDHPI